MSEERRTRPTRRHTLRSGGRRATDTPETAWTTGQLADYIGMSAAFVRAEIRAGEIVASKFGTEHRIASAEVHRYLMAKKFPLPDTFAS